MPQEQQNPFLEQEIDIRQYWNILLERRWLIVSFTVILCTLSLIRSFMMEPVYEGATRVLIEKEAPRVVKMDEVAPVEVSTREYYQTQYKILKSRAIAERVDRELDGYVPWGEWFGRKPEKEISRQDRISALLDVLEIRPMPNTQLVEISIEDPDPELATKIANLWASNYIAYVLDAKYEAAQYASGWLQEKIKEARKGLELSEAKLQEYRKQHNILHDEDDTPSEDVLEQLLKRKAGLEIELAEKQEYFKPRHPEIIGLKSEIESVDRKINAEEDQEILSKDKAIQYNILKREVETNRHIYESLLKSIKETEVTGELKTTNIRVVDKAIVPERPVKPRKKLNLLIALLIGLFGGSGIALALESLDQSIKNPEDIKNHIKLPSLASISVPRADADKQVPLEFITQQRPKSTISESYRSLRTSIIFTAVEHRRKTIVVTSSGPQEGKTTTAINLAVAMAQAGEKTILLDADLRQPKIEKKFNISLEHGMSEVLAESEPLDKVIHKTDIENLDIIACGAIPPNPSELVGSKRMSALLDELASRYDRVIVDTPPVLAVTDAVVLSGKVDGTIMVVRAGETNRNAVLKTKEILEHVQATNLIGVVLNMVEADRSGGYYYYYHYYGKKYGHYGADGKKKNE